MIYIRRHRYNSRGQLLVRFEILDNAGKLDDCFENHYIDIKLSGKTDGFFLKELDSLPCFVVIFYIMKHMCPAYGHHKASPYISCPQAHIL